MRSKIAAILFMVTMAGLYGQPNNRIARTPKLNYDWRPGFVSITELTGAPGLGLTDDELSKYYYGITTVAGYQFSRNIKAGIGAGVHMHNEGYLLPLFVDARYSLSAQDLVPFIAAAGGIAVDTKVIEDTRVFINPSIGARYVMVKNTAVTFSTGLMVTTGGPDSRKSFLNFKLGLELKGK